MSILTRELRKFRRNTTIPKGWRVVDYRDYKNIAVIAPLGVHWAVKAWNWFHVGVEYRWSQAIQKATYSSQRWAYTGTYPRCIEVQGDNVAQRAGYGLVYKWEGDDDSFGRVIAPWGLNLVYALVRYCKWR